MFKTKYFWKGYILGIAIALLGFGYIVIKVNTKRTAETISGFNELSFVSLKGDTLNIKKAGSDPVLINYWATYCAPCIEEMPLLLAFSKKNPQVKLWLLTKENSDIIAKFITKHPELKELNFAQLIKTKTTIGINGIDALLPSTFLVKANGAVLWENDGGLIYETPQEMLDSIQKIVPEIKNIVSELK
jgi:thiol-disulfide isomerase/thioredoxin